jgi:hypothetical protein
MARSKRPQQSSAGSAAVAQYLASLKHPQTATVKRLRLAILAVDSRIQEDVKWNAPSFHLGDHFATFRLNPPPILQLILHNGARAKSNPTKFIVDDPDRILKWAAPDRCIIEFTSSADATRKMDALMGVLRAWIEQL